MKDSVLAQLYEVIFLLASITNKWALLFLNTPLKYDLYLNVFFFCLSFLFFFVVEQYIFTSELVNGVTSLKLASFLAECNEKVWTQIDIVIKQ